MIITALTMAGLAFAAWLAVEDYRYWMALEEARADR